MIKNYQQEGVVKNESLVKRCYNTFLTEIQNDLKIPDSKDKSCRIIEKFINIISSFKN